LQGRGCGWPHEKEDDGTLAEPAVVDNLLKEGNALHHAIRVRILDQPLVKLAAGCNEDDAAREETDRERDMARKRRRRRRRRRLNRH